MLNLSKVKVTINFSVKSGIKPTLANHLNRHEQKDNKPYYHMVD